MVEECVMCLHPPSLPPPLPRAVITVMGTLPVILFQQLLSALVPGSLRERKPQSIHLALLWFLHWLCNGHSGLCMWSPPLPASSCCPFVLPSGGLWTRSGLDTPPGCFCGKQNLAFGGWAQQSDSTISKYLSNQIFPPGHRLSTLETTCLSFIKPSSECSLNPGYIPDILDKYFIEWLTL
jgi:hypothetical protein